ncbi:osteopetrosis-associated transmembrane protein 1-like isoform X2 [Antedon mediterranea]|uniref:osteopetrosis-associated transmembrane protein 1-like isoform X2 n=1 Tax=Antedon mediterranea TaxID=105859 RepID=UPI003AF8C7DF
MGSSSLVNVLTYSMFSNDQIEDIEKIVSGDACKEKLENYAVTSSQFMECAVKHAKPLNFCERCVSKYMQVLKAYNKINNETKCSSHLLRSDYLQVISTTNQFLKDLWNTGNCNNCFEFSNCNDTYTLNKQTAQFFKLFNQTMDCFQNFSIADLAPSSPSNRSISALCIECKHSYKQMFKVYKNIRSVIGETEMCVDVMEKMNTTQRIMSSDYHCNIHDKNTEVVMGISVFFCVLPVIFYLLIRWYGGKHNQKSFYGICNIPSLVCFRLVFSRTLSWDHCRYVTKTAANIFYGTPILPQEQQANAVI